MEQTDVAGKNRLFTVHFILVVDSVIVVTVHQQHERKLLRVNCMQGNFFHFDLQITLSFLSFLSLSLFIFEGNLGRSTQSDVTMRSTHLDLLHSSAFSLFLLQTTCLPVWWVNVLALATAKKEAVVAGFVAPLLLLLFQCFLFLVATSQPMVTGLGDGDICPQQQIQIHTDVCP